MGEPLAVEWLGTLPYAEALALQQRRVEERRAGRAVDALLLLEHPPVITLGRSARRENLLASPAELADRGIAVHEVARGGDVTYHGPGQLVGYLVLDLEARGAADVHRYLRSVEDTLIEALAVLGVAGEALAGMTGVFVRAPAGGARRKLASIGVGLRGWVTCHGFALNVDVDLAGFAAIVPCGLQGVEMTSVERELPPPVSAGLANRARRAVAEAFAKRW
jgi:lipoyl(octanoyl) transferase